MSVYAISKTFAFSAAHRLAQLPEEHKCHRLHGHNYEVTFVLQAETLNEYGFVEDYAQLNDMKLFIDSALDHRDLTELLPFDVTAEALAA